jgi:hypothetical protein
MRRFATTAAAVLLLAALATSASASSPATRGVLPPQAHVHGQSLTDIGAAFMYWNWSTPVATNPLVTGKCEPWPADPRIWFLPQTLLDPHPTWTCDVPEGVFLVVSPYTVECSNVEDSPFYGADAAQQRACADAAYALTTSLSVIVDGRDATGLDWYAVATPYTRLPDENLFTDLLGLPPQETWTTGVGVFLVLAPLSPGSHVVSTDAFVEAWGWGAGMTYEITVR